MPLCHYCKVAPGSTRDHIIPKSRGGPTARWNIVAACSRCNHRKANKWPECTCQKCKQAVWRYDALMRGERWA